MREKPPPLNFSAAAAFLEDKCLDFTDCGLGIFCKSLSQPSKVFQKINGFIPLIINSLGKTPLSIFIYFNKKQASIHHKLR